MAASQTPGENEEGLEEGVDNQTRWLRRAFAEAKSNDADEALKKLLEDQG